MATNITSLLDRVPVERISDEAHQINFGRILLTIIVGIFYAIGWIAGKVFIGLAFCIAATKIGFQEARNPTNEGLARARSS